MRTPAQPRAWLLGLVLLTWCAAGQPSFEVASIKPTQPAVGPRGGWPEFSKVLAPRPGTIPMPDPGRVVIQNMTVLALVATAYRVQTTQVRGPEWMGVEAYAVDAKVPAGTPRGQVNEMLQSLLKERFGLVVHHEQKDLPGYVLLVGKGGAKLTPSGPAGEPPVGQDQQTAAAAEGLRKMLKASTPQSSGATYRVPRADAERLAVILSRLTLEPVVDMTGLKGTYDVTLSVDQDGSLDSVFVSVEKLGLKLENRRVPTDTLVVDKISRTPTAN